MKENPPGIGSSQALKKAIPGDGDVVWLGKCLPDEGGSEVRFQHCMAHACNPGTWIRRTHSSPVTQAVSGQSAYMRPYLKIKTTKAFLMMTVVSLQLFFTP